MLNNLNITWNMIVLYRNSPFLQIRTSHWLSDFRTRNGASVNRKHEKFGPKTVMKTMVRKPMKSAGTIRV